MLIFAHALALGRVAPGQLCQGLLNGSFLLQSAFSARYAVFAGLNRAWVFSLSQVHRQPNVLPTLYQLTLRLTVELTASFPIGSLFGLTLICFCPGYGYQLVETRLCSVFHHCPFLIFGRIGLSIPFRYSHFWATSGKLFPKLCLDFKDPRKPIFRISLLANTLFSNRWNPRKFYYTVGNLYLLGVGPGAVPGVAGTYRYPFSTFQNAKTFCSSYLYLYTSTLRYL